MDIQLRVALSRGGERRDGKRDATTAAVAVSKGPPGTEALVLPGRQSHRAIDRRNTANGTQRVASTRRGASTRARPEAEQRREAQREKSPLGILGELPHLIATGYADIPEEDIVRLKWWGLYHDKPKIGTFMLRIKLPAGRVLPAQLRAVGELSNTHGRGQGELSTRQTIQLHYLDLPSLPSVFDRLGRSGSRPRVPAATRCATSPVAPCTGSRTTSSST